MRLVPPYIESILPYVPGKPVEEVEREYGVSNVAKLASNENALGPSPKALAAAREACGRVHLYPDGSALGESVVADSDTARKWYQKAVVQESDLSDCDEELRDQYRNP